MSDMSVSIQLRQGYQSVQGLASQTSAVNQGGETNGSVDSAAAATPSDAADAKNQLNVQILQASVEVSIQAGDQSQSLLFRAAIDHINQLLAPELGTDAIQSKSSEDNSPEATAQRIVSLSTGFYDAYAAQHPDKDPAQLAKDFVDLIRGGFEQGFKEAKDILQGLKVLNGDIASGIQKTYDLVSKGYDDFLASKLNPPTDTASATNASSSDNAGDSPDKTTDTLAATPS